MVPVFSLLLLVAIFVLTVRMAIAALVMTGMAPERATLQAVSAFTGVGFTTTESEEIVGDPLRRRVLIWVMILGNAGFVSAASTLFLSFESVASRFDGAQRLVLLLLGIGALWLVARSKWLEARLLWFVGALLKRWSRPPSARDVHLFGFSGEHVVRVFRVPPDGWYVGRTLSELPLREHDINVVGIRRASGEHVGLPDGQTRIEAGDELVLYGSRAALEAVLQAGAEHDSPNAELPPPD